LLPAECVLKVLERLEQQHGLTKQLRVDNGLELISAKLLVWCKDRGIAVVHTQPDKPPQNALIERFNGPLRRELLNAYLFETLTQLREMLWLGRLDYNKQ
jgi:putative transposase